jgi:hypothetical protein
MRERPGDVEQVRKRVYRYWYEDGLAEIATGCLFVLIGLVLGAQWLIPSGSPLTAIAGLAFPVVVIGGILAVRHLVNVAKERITYPRTGYVQYGRPGPRRRRLAAVLGGSMGIVVAILFANGPASLMWLPLFQGLIIGAFWLYMGTRLDLLRFYVLAVLSVLIGIGIAFSGLADPLGSAAYFGGMGIVMVAGGGLALRSYLRQTQPAEEGEQA